MSAVKEISKHQIAKQKDHAFKKDLYLLGVDSEGIKYWLESPSWDCNWYWGFGYVETFQANKMPSKAKDINSHSHIDSSFLGQQYEYDYKTSQYKKLEYIHNLYDCPTFTRTTFSEKEGWTLSELFKSFYMLRGMAEMYHSGGAHITTNPCAHLLNNKEQEDHINKVLIPAVTSEILKILTPKYD
jgi:hypothetical protein